jgi:hypothetical protein
VGGRRAHHRHVYPDLGLGTGREAGYTITNHAAAAVSGWTAAFDLRAGQQMGNYRNALEAVSGNRISFANRSYNGGIAADGGMAATGLHQNFRRLHRLRAQPNGLGLATQVGL